MSLKTIALVAHDHKKADIVVWAQRNKEALALFKLVATGTTGSLLIKKVGLDITCLQSGPLGGDQQIGALIAEQNLDALFFFWDPMNPVPHDPDVKALLRLCSVWNIPVACNVSSADMLVSSPLFLNPNYKPDRPNYGK